MFIYKVYILQSNLVSTYGRIHVLKIAGIVSQNEMNYRVFQGLNGYMNDKENKIIIKRNFIIS